MKEFVRMKAEKLILPKNVVQFQPSSIDVLLDTKTVTLKGDSFKQFVGLMNLKLPVYRYLLEKETHELQLDVPQADMFVFTEKDEVAFLYPEATLNPIVDYLLRTYPATYSRFVFTIEVARHNLVINYGVFGKHLVVTAGYKDNTVSSTEKIDLAKIQDMNHDPLKFETFLGQLSTNLQANTIKSFASKSLDNNVSVDEMLRFSTILPLQYTTKIQEFFKLPLDQVMKLSRKKLSRTYTDVTARDLLTLVPNATPDVITNKAGMLKYYMKDQGDSNYREATFNIKEESKQ